MVIKYMVGARHTPYSLEYCSAAHVQVLETEVAQVTTEPYPGLASHSCCGCSTFFFFLNLCIYFWVRGMHAQAAVYLWSMEDIREHLEKESVVSLRHVGSGD